MAVYEPDELMPKVKEYARQIARGPATAIQLAKKLVYRSANIPFDEHLDVAQMAMFIAQTTEDAIPASGPPGKSTSGITGTTIPAFALRSAREYWLIPFVTRCPASDAAATTCPPGHMQKL